MIPSKHIASTSNLSSLHFRFAKAPRHTLAAGSDTYRHSRPHTQLPPSCGRTRLCVVYSSTTPYHRLLSTKTRKRGQPSDLGLGLRTAKPPDSSEFPIPYELPPPYTLNLSEQNPNSNDQSPKEKCKEVSDQEWELRTGTHSPIFTQPHPKVSTKSIGRAIYVIQETLPSFFETGLITSVDKTTGAPKAPGKSSPLHIPIIDSAATLEFLSASASTSGSASRPDFGENAAGATDAQEDEEEGIYSPNIRLQYTPPIALPAPFPKTFKLQGACCGLFVIPMRIGTNEIIYLGIQLYLASSALVRHTMNTLYHDLEVGLSKVSVHSGPPPPDHTPDDSTSYSSLSSELGYSPQSGDKGVLTSGEGQETRKRRVVSRDKYLLVRQVVSGVNRVSGQTGEWEV